MADSHSHTHSGNPGPSGSNPSDPGPPGPKPSDPGPSGPNPSGPKPSDPGPSDPGPDLRIVARKNVALMRQDWEKHREKFKTLFTSKGYFSTRNPERSHVADIPESVMIVSQHRQMVFYDKEDYSAYMNMKIYKKVLENEWAQFSRHRSDFKRDVADWKNKVPTAKSRRELFDEQSILMQVQPRLAAYRHEFAEFREVFKKERKEVYRWYMAPDQDDDDQAVEDNTKATKSGHAVDFSTPNTLSSAPSFYACIKHNKRREKGTLTTEATVESVIPLICVRAVGTTGWLGGDRYGFIELGSMC
ncbi:hypothetical protein GGS20DRAFT_544100 [Poronia punctata]|nr:hypothetical protein GGS20DRAFT_544100 [Poronia punctata]